MNSWFSSLVTACLLGFCVNLSAQPLRPIDPMTTQTSTPAILATLRPDHPRLVALDSDVETAIKLLHANPNGVQWFAQLRQSADAILSQPPVEHKLEGPRLLTQSRRALDRITLLGLMHRMQPNKKYVDRAVLEMETACAFPDWNPSHFLDTAEMTNAMAIGYDWFYKDLSPETRRKVREGIVKLGLREGLKMYDEKKPSWIKGHNNWNQVCNGGLMVGALAIADEEPEIAAAILNRGKESLAHGMALFAPDGAWLEAPGYWVYTMKYTCQVLSAMHTALGTAFGLDEVPGFANTGNFMLAMEGPTGKYFNWGDCGEKVGNLPEMFWLARRFDKPVYAGVAEAHIGGTLSPMDLFWHMNGKSPAEAGTALDWYFRDSEVVSHREKWGDPKASFVAMKGGQNNAPHSNVDLGTFVFDADGERWAMDLGSDDYNLPDYWNKQKRLYIYRIRTEGQNTLVLNGENQNLRGKSKITRHGGNDNVAFAVADLKNAYKGQAANVQRGIRLDGGRRHLVVQDELKSNGPLDILWCMHTQAKVQVADDGKSASMQLGKSAATIKVIEPAGSIITVKSAEQKPPQKSNKGISRVEVKHKTTGAGNTRLVVQISPGSAKPFTYTPTPISDWK